MDMMKRLICGVLEHMPFEKLGKIDIFLQKYQISCGSPCIQSFAINTDISPQQCTTVEEIFLCLLQYLDEDWSGFREFWNFGR
jgi:hypothetical protein